MAYKGQVLIIDDSALWIRQGTKLLEQAGYAVAGMVVSEPHELTVSGLPTRVHLALSQANVLLVDKDIGKGITSTRLICVVRNNFPNLPIIRWTGGYDSTPYMQYLRVSTIEKPVRKNEAEFVGVFVKALEEQCLILSGPMGIYATLDETVAPNEYAEKSRTNRLRQIGEIAQLADNDRARNSENYRYAWGITGQDVGMTMHEFGHCICDGDLHADDISPYLVALQKVVARLRAAGEVDERFRICAEFIEVGNLDELELIRNCY